MVCGVKVRQCGGGPRLHFVVADIKVALRLFGTVWEVEDGWKLGSGWWLVVDGSNIQHVGDCWTSGGSRWVVESSWWGGGGWVLEVVWGWWLMGDNVEGEGGC